MMPAMSSGATTAPTAVPALMMPIAVARSLTANHSVTARVAAGNPPPSPMPSNNRLANGNTVICNWCPADLKDPKLWPGSVQVLEVTPEKKVVWALDEWKDPDLGPASSIQLLDEPGIPENGDLQR